MIKMMICDDDCNYLESMKEKVNEICESYGRDVEIYTYDSGKKVIDILCKKREQFNVLFLDIDMPDKSGLQVADAIRECKVDVTIIFISAHERYVFESLEFAPFRYIRKNLTDQELPSAIRAILRKIDSNQSRTTVVKYQDGRYAIKHSDIMFYKVKGHNIEIFLNNDKVLVVRKTVKRFFDEMRDKKFIKIYSGCVVNVQYIQGLEKDEVILDNGRRLLASHGRIKDIKVAFMDYWRKQI